MRAAFVFLFAATLCAVPAHADTAMDELVQNLDRPWSLAVQPETGTMFVSESGAGRVVQIVDGELVQVISGFPREPLGNDPTLCSGPLGLCFLDKNTLVVGQCGLPPAEDQLRVYDLGKKEGDPINVDDAVASFSLPPSDDLDSAGGFLSLAAGERELYAACRGDSAKGWIARTKRNGNQLDLYKRLLSTKELSGVGTPGGLTLSPRGHLVVGEMGELDAAQDSHLCFYRPEPSALLMKLPVGLYDLAGLAYSEKTGQLYAVDVAWKDAGKGGLYRIVATRSAMKIAAQAERIAPLPRPTALAFDAQGGLCVTLLGEAPGQGKLVRFAPGL
jgi:hypothetical protein